MYLELDALFALLPALRVDFQLDGALWTKDMDRFVPRPMVAALRDSLRGQPSGCTDCMRAWVMWGVRSSVGGV